MIGGTAPFTRETAHFSKKLNNLVLLLQGEILLILLELLQVLDVVEVMDSR